MLPNSGFSLVELLVVLAISTFLVGTLIYSCNQAQIVTHDISLLADRNVNSWIAPPLIAQWTAGAGNNRWEQEWDGVTLASETSYFKSDMDGNGGFPDEELASSYESIGLRVNKGNLCIQSGQGSFQPILRSFQSLNAEWKEEDLLIVKWISSTKWALKAGGESVPSSAEMCVHLWNYRPNLFMERDP